MREGREGAGRFCVIAIDIAAGASNPHATNANVPCTSHRYIVDDEDDDVPPIIPPPPSSPTAS